MMLSSLRSTAQEYKKTINRSSSIGDHCLCFSHTLRSFAQYDRDMAGDRQKQHWNSKKMDHSVRWTRGNGREWKVYALKGWAREIRNPARRRFRGDSDPKRFCKRGRTNCYWRRSRRRGKI